MQTYWTSLEFKISDPAKFQDCAGGYVYLLVTANDVLDALPKIEASVKDMNFSIIEIEFIAPYEDIPWEDKEENIKYDALAEKASASDEVIWDEMYLYESRAD